MLKFGRLQSGCILQSGYRNQSLEGLSNQLQLKVLTTAEEAIRRLSEGRRKASHAAILLDRQRILSQ